MSPGRTVLNQDGKVDYFPSFITCEKTEKYFEELRSEIKWSKDELIMFGRNITMRRESAWFAEGGKSYKYTGINRVGLTWTPRLIHLKKAIEDFLDTSFNSCLANYYHDGSDGMGFHSDDEKMLNANIPIASISLGADRIFQFQHKKSKEKKKVFLESGSLLVMHPPCQEYWKHALPKNKNQDQPRINLTFRVVLNN